MYRLYRLRDGRLAYATAFQCEDDRTAVLLAEDALEGEAGELWCWPRLVKQIAGRG